MAQVVGASAQRATQMQTASSSASGQICHAQAVADLHGRTRLTSTQPMFQSCSELHVEMYQARNYLSEQLLSRTDHVNGCQHDRAAVICGGVASVRN